MKKKNEMCTRVRFDPKNKSHNQLSRQAILASEKIRKSNPIIKYDNYNNFTNLSSIKSNKELKFDDFIFQDSFDSYQDDTMKATDFFKNLMKTVDYQKLFSNTSSQFDSKEISQFTFKDFYINKDEDIFSILEKEAIQIIGKEKFYHIMNHYNQLELKETELTDANIQDLNEFFNISLKHLEEKEYINVI